MILKIILLAIIAWLIYRNWEWFKLASAVFVVMTVFVVLGIAFYIYWFVQYIFNLITILSRKITTKIT
jgi:hypothetical protein